MNVAGIEVAKRVIIPKWESELWFYIASSDGEHCPLYNICSDKIQGNLCPCDYVGYVEELLVTVVNQRNETLFKPNTLA